MSSTLSEVTLVSPDISCGHCVATVKDAVAALAGVAKVDADPDTKRIDISFNADQVSIGQIQAALDEAGYPVQK